MTDSDRYDANVAVIEKYFTEEFPGCGVSSFRDHPVTITAAEVLTHTFKVDAGEWHFLARATEELLRDLPEQGIADYLRTNGVAGQMRGAATRSGWLLLRTTGTEEKHR